MLTLDWLAQLVDQNRAALTSRVAEFSIRGQHFAFNSSPTLMGVINLSPDSWYRESVVMTAEAAISKALVLQAQGAPIVDIGAESTLAHALRVDEIEQNSKLLPIVRALAAKGPIISVETYQPAVAQACLESGAGILNLTGCGNAEAIYPIVADHDAAVIICYLQGANAREVEEFDFAADPISLMHEYFAREINRATKAGVTRIFIDPGMGFYYKNLQDSSVRVRHQMRTFLSTFRLRTLGFPICHALPHAFEFFGEEVRSAEPFFALLAALGKTDLFRTHEVARTKAVLDTLGAF